MREIKFRGKRLDNGEWVYGCYTFSLKDNRHIIWVQSENYGETWHTYPIVVYGKSIGQYTGLKDKNGKEIYEGDIVKISESNWWQSHKIIKEKYNAVVFFNERTQEIQFKEVGGRYRIDYHYFLQDNETKLYFEVIGNIHENPELLKDSK